MKIAHEAPLSIFDNVQRMTDYDYALVHLFEESEAYLDKFVKAKKNGREIILDNSIFELGESFNGDLFAEWVDYLNPDWYIIPDVLDNAEATIDSYERFVDTYPNLPGKSIAVVQGNSVAEVIDCYTYFDHAGVDKIAFSFNHPFFQKLDLQNQYYNMMYGRQLVIDELLYRNIINEDKPHHLLGCGLPQEFKAYKNYKWIDSLDTSNPVIHGMKGIKYDSYGLKDKESVKLFTLIDEDIRDRWTDIAHNINAFRKLCKG